MAIDQLIISDPRVPEERSGQIVIFGGDPHPHTMPFSKGGGSGVKVMQRIDINPNRWDGDNQVSATETQLCRESDFLVPNRNLFTHDVFAGNANIDAASGQFARDF